MQKYEDSSNWQNNVSRVREMRYKWMLPKQSQEWV